MANLRQKLADPQIIIMDGATGTQLQNLGLPAGTAPELWNLNCPEVVKQHHQSFVDAGSDHISVQVETCVHLHRTIQLIKDSGAKAGAVLNPATPIAALDWVLNELDIVLVMSVNPGFGGQTFIPSALGKISVLRQIITDRSLDTLIAVDGGVNDGTIESIARAGADVFIAGSAVYGKSDYTAAIQDFKEKIAANPPAANS